MKRYMQIAIGLFVLHTIEESLFQFWDNDPFTALGATLVHLPVFWVYWIVQAILYSFLLCLLFLPNVRFRKWGSVALAIILLFEMEHLVIALGSGYVPGLATGTLLSAYGVFYSTMLINKRLAHIKIPISEEWKRKLIGFVSLVALLYAVMSLASFLPARPSSALSKSLLAGAYATTTEQVSEEVLPKEGFQTKIVLGNVVPTMVADGIIDMSKVEALYKNSGGIPPDEMKMLTEPSNVPLTINAGNANWLIDILWPIGLSNKMGINDTSPIAGKNVNHFASTGGWSLGKQSSGGAYFNAYSLIPLTTDQEQHVKQIAGNVFRPCCDNSTFFQDCNHGSAALALVELGVAQGLPDTEIYKTLLDFNSFWFQQDYVETALYFKVIKNTDWSAIDPRLILTKDYSSISGWSKNVDAVVSKIPGLIPQTQTGGSCGV